MSDLPTISSTPVPHCPWQDRPADCDDVIWRYDQNPLIGRRPFPGARSVYNSAVVPYEGAFVGVFRVDYKCVAPNVHFGTSPDGLDWTLQPNRIDFVGADPEIATMEYGYDPRLVLIDDTYYVHWCNGYKGLPTIGLARTRDFKTFEQMENAFLPYNRNGVLFPRKINGHYAMLSRPSGPGHNAYGDIFYSESPDLTFWGRHRQVMARGYRRWERTKIGAGPTPIETNEGWLMIYHGVMDTCNGFVYSFGMALLDLDQPWKVIRRLDHSLLWPERDYETTGHVANVVFPCAAVCDSATGRLAIYYGAADTHVAVAFAHIDELLAYLKAHSE